MPLASVVRVVPTALLMAASVAMAVQGGSVDAPDWLPYAILAALLLATLLVSGTTIVPARLSIAAAVALLAFAVWTAVSAAWAPRPAAARDEALLAVFYVIVLLVPLLSLRTAADRVGATAVVVAGTGGLAVGTAVWLLLADDPSALYDDGRLFVPISYWNAQVALFLVGFWPAVALAARRSFPFVGRVLAFAAAVASLAGLLLIQSKGGTIALVLSAIVVFAVAPFRLRLGVPTLVAAALAAAVFDPLTEPWRRRLGPDAPFDESIGAAGETVLWLTAFALVVGAVYVLVDRRLELPARTLRLVRVVALAATIAALGAGVVTFVAAVGSPGAWVDERWEAFKNTEPRVEREETHLLALASGRYDFWRVALAEFREHPVAGHGARAFSVFYLQEGRTAETPLRAHSLELDVLSETGIIGFLLLAGAVGTGLAVALYRARNAVLGAGVLGGAVYWIIHASGDWNWTFPAVGIPFFLLLGIAGSTDRRVPVGRWAAIPMWVATLAVAFLVFAPPWLASRFTDRALEGTQDADIALSRARFLDPLSVAPYVAEATLAERRPAKISALRRAVDKEPRSVELWYRLGCAYLNSGRERPGRRALLRARELYPDDPFTARALEQGARGCAAGT